MSKRVTKILSLILTLVMFLSVSTPAFALGGGELGEGWDREIGEDEVLEAHDTVEEAEEELDYFQTLDEYTGVQVTVEAPLGALPTLAEVRAERVEAEAIREAVDSVLEGNPEILLALDISFWLNGIEIEPEEPVRVKIAAPELEDKTNLTLVHIPDAAEPETVELIDEGDLSFALGTNEIAFQADSFSIYVITDDSGLKTPRATYHFLADVDGTPFTFMNKAGEEVNYQIVKDGELLDDPGQPVVGLEKNFLGWFVVEKNGDTYTFPEGGHPIDFTQTPPVMPTITTGDLDVYVAPRYGQAFIVTYWDNAKGSPEDQMHIVAKRVVYLDEGAEFTSVRVDDVTVPSAATQVLSGWTSDDYKAGEQTTYSLTEKPVWDEVANSFNLYPIFSDGHWLRFSGGPAGSGAGYRQAIFVTANTQPSELQNLGTVAREGYTFAGWYYDGYEGTEAATNASGAALNAADLLSRVQDLGEGEFLTLYANWTGNQVTYKVATWFENADDTEYAYGELTEATGTAGTTTNVTAAAVTGFTAEPIEQQTIKGDGTTVINVYYKRNIYTIRFYNKRGTSEFTDLRITAKYGADIHDQWPGTKEGTDNYSSAWDLSTGTNSRYVVTISTMPLNGTNFYQHSDGSYAFQIKRYVQSVNGDNTFIDYNRSPFGGNRTDAIGAEDFMHIDGFRVNAYSSQNATSIRQDATGDPDAVCETNYTRSVAINTAFRNGDYENNRYTLKIYYLRNQYNVNFDTQKSGAATPDPLTGIYYEANIASTKATQIAALNQQYQVGKTTVEVTGEGTYVFQGWYDNADGMGEPFNFNQKMPAGNITLYAKWERVYYLIQIDPRGGEILPDINEVTYTWLQYGDKLEQYNIRRDFVEANSDYTGDKYYYVSVLADDDPNAREAEGYFWSGYRKGFYIKTTDVNNSEYSWWKEHSFIDTSVEYMPATTNDNWAFVGWYKATVDPTTHAVTDTNYVYDFSSLITGETAIYAKWRRSGLFTVQYHTENGPVSGQINGNLVAIDASYSDQATTKLSYKPDKITSTDGKGYVFVGWKLAQPAGFNPNDPGSATLVGDLMQQGDDFLVDANYADSGHYIHLVAVYELASANPDTLPVTTVTFNPNFPDGATGTSGEVTKYEGVPLNTAIDLSTASFTYTVIEDETEKEKTCVIPTFTWTGYTLIGWHHDQAAATAGTVEFKLTDVVGIDNEDPDDNTLYAVWERQHFYVFHSSNGKLQALEMPTDANATVDLTTLLSPDTLYGGYFMAYLNDEAFATDENKAAALAAGTDGAVITSYTYDGTATYTRVDSKIKLFWSKAKAYTTDGRELVPEVEKVYYLREVPNYFLNFRLQYVYNVYTKGIDNLYLITSLDNNVYSEAGFYVMVQEPDDKEASFYASYKIAFDDPDPEKAWSVTINGATINDHGGIVGVWEGVEDLINALDPNTQFTVLPYWITLDGVRVDDTFHGFRTFDIGDKTVNVGSGIKEV